MTRWWTSTRWVLWLVWCAWLGACADDRVGLEIEVVDLRQSGSAGGDGEWVGDTLIVDTPCLDAGPLYGASLDEACDEVAGGRAHTGEDRIAATVFDDASCTRAAGFLPPLGGTGEATLPRAGLGVVLRCAVAAEPR